MSTYSIYSAKRGGLGRLLGVALSLMFAAMSAHAVFTVYPAPNNVGSTLDGCKNDPLITLPNGGGQFVCPDTYYTPGNLGKNWNELDLVPYRLTMAAGSAAPATQTYTVAVVVDY